MVLNHCILEDKDQKRKNLGSESDQEYIYYYEFIEDLRADTVQPKSKYATLRMARLLAEKWGSTPLYDYDTVYS